jgi:hypothetical protein
MKNNKTLRNILIGAGIISILALGNKTKSIESFTGNLKSSEQICNHVSYTFDIGGEKIKSYEGVPKGLKPGKTYEITIEKKYLFPDKISYKKLK